MNLDVYRLEHPQTQQGPFRHLANESQHGKNGSAEYSAWLLERLEKTSGHLPSAEIDLPGFRPGVDVCAAPSVEELSRWFGYYWNRLLEYGFQLYRYTVPNLETQKGKAQVVFDPRAAVGRELVVAYTKGPLDNPQEGQL